MFTFLSTYCFLSETGEDSANDRDDKIISTVKDTKLYAPVVNLRARDNRKLSKILSKGLERSV